MTASGREHEAERPYTHVCMDCGALGIAGGYHDHGDGNAGETIALAQLPGAVHSMQQFESRAYEAEAERDRVAEEKVAEIVAWCYDCGLNGMAAAGDAIADRFGSVAGDANEKERP